MQMRMTWQTGLAYSQGKHIMSDVRPFCFLKEIAAQPEDNPC